MTIADLNWLAGIIDSEGCIFGRCNPKSVRCSVKITMKHLPAMKKVQALLRCIIGRKPNLNAGKGRYAGVFTIRVGTKASLYKLLPLLLSTLTAKRRQVLVALRAINCNDPDLIELLRQLKRNPDPNHYEAGGVETRPGDPIAVRDVGWLAGILDGDGGFYAAPPEIKLDNCELLLMQRAQAIIYNCTGHKLRIKPRAFSNPKWRTCYQMRTRNRSVIDSLVTELAPYLVVTRDAAVRAILQPRRKLVPDEDRVQV